MMEKGYLLDIIPFSDGLLANCADQIELENLQDVIHFISHFLPYIDMLRIYEGHGIVIGGRRFFEYEKVIYEYSSDGEKGGWAE